MLKTSGFALMAGASNKTIKAIKHGCFISGCSSILVVRMSRNEWISAEKEL